jgi:cytochrome P450
MREQGGGTSVALVGCQGVKSYAKLGVPPGPSPLNAIAQYAGGSFARAPHYLLSYARRYGPIWSFRFFERRIFVIDDAEGVRTVLVDKQRLFGKSRMLRLKPVMGDGLLTSEGPLHVRQRRLIQPAFQHSRIAGYADVIVAETLRMIDKWDEGVSVDLRAQMLRLTVTITGAALFGADITNETENVRAATEELVTVFPRELSLWTGLVNRLPPFRPRPLDAIRKRLDVSLARIIRDRQAKDAGDDLLAMLLSAQDEDGCSMSSKQLHDEAITLLLGGHETTANALIWALVLIGFYAPVRERLQAEIDAVVGDATPRYEHVRDLRYTAAVFEETLRLYPPVWAFGRRATQDLELLGYRIPMGSTVVMSPYVTHRNPRYFADPLAFKPERWLEGERPPKLAYFPFGGGARGCIGEPFARLEAVLTLATIFSRVRLIPNATTLPDVAPKLTLRPAHPVMMTPSQRGSTRTGISVKA